MKSVMLVIHFLGLAMGIGTGIGHMFLGMAAAKMEKSEALKFTMNTFALSRMGTIGITMLIISGLYLITPYWSLLANFPYLVVKLSLVLLLVVLLIIIGRIAGKAKKSDDPMPYLKRIRSISPFTLIISILIVIMAVLTFH
jgi:uncharacterized membrane protein